MINILILAAGKGQSSIEDQLDYPVCLTEHNGISVLEQIVSNLSAIRESQYTFVLHAQDIAKYHTDRIAKLLVPNAVISVVPENTMGSGCTALLGACQLNLEIPLIIVSANELVEHDLKAAIDEFEARKLDAGTLIFRSIHPRYSYVRVVDGLVVEAAQQKPISQMATTGIFWFRSTADFVEAAKAVIRKNASTNGKFYIAPTFNELILKQKRVGVCEIGKDHYVPLKNRQQIHQYEQG